MGQNVLLKDLFREKMKGQWYTRKKKINKSLKRETGFLKVRRQVCATCPEKFIYVYRNIDDNGNVTQLMSIDFLKLRDRVRDHGLEWEISDRVIALKTAKDIGLQLSDLL